MPVPTSGSVIPPHAAVVDISSTDHACDVNCVGITTGLAGVIKYTMGSGVITQTVVAGQTIIGQISLVWKTGTTVTTAGAITEFFVS